MNVYGKVKQGRGSDDDEPAVCDPGDPAPASAAGTASAAVSLSPDVLHATPVAMPAAVVRYLFIFSDTGR